MVKAVSMCGKVVDVPVADSESADGDKYAVVYL